MNKQILFGSAVKSTVNPWDVDSDIGWQSLNGTSLSSIDLYFSRVPWFRRGVKDRALNVSALPWSMFMGDDEVANSAEWSDEKPRELEWLDNPRKLFTQIEQSLSVTARSYVALECNPAGYIKGAKYCAPSTITEVYDQATGKLIGYDRAINGRVVRCDPASAKFRNGVLRIVAIYDADYLSETDHPANSSDGLAALTASGVLFNTDEFVKTFFARGAIKASILTVDGGTQPEIDRLQSWWDDVINGVKNAWAALVMRGKFATVTPIGSGIEGLENDSLTTSRRQDIATALGVPESRMWSSAANYATRNADEKAYFRGTIIPEFDLIAEAFNSQIFTDLHHLNGWRIESQPETMDVFQADETERASALSSFIDSIIKAETLELAQASFQVIGYDIPASAMSLLEKHYAKKETAPELPAAPIEPMQPVTEAPALPEPVVEDMPEMDEMPTMSVDTLKELQIWQRKSIREWKASGSAVVEFTAVHIPAGVYERVNDGLKAAADIDGIKRIFESATVEPVQDDPWLEAAQRLAAALESLHE